MGSKSAGPGGQNDVPAFDMPPTRTYTPEEWSAKVGPDGGYPDPRVIRQGPQTGGPMMPFQPGPQMIPQGMGPGLGGQGPRPQMSPEDTIRMMYQTQMGRAPDQGGMDYWRQQMAGGMTPDQIQNAFRASQEGQAYQQRMASTPQMSPEVMEALRLAQPSNNPDQLSPESFLDSLYQSQLGRLPDLPGRTYWRTRMDQGTSPSRIREEFQFTPERQQVYNQRYTQTGSVPADIPPWMRPDRFVAQPPALPQSRPTTQSQANPQPSTQSQNQPYVMGLLRSLGVL